MKSTRLVLLMIALVTVLVMVGGCSRHYVDVYVNDQCYLVTLGGAVIDPLLVHPGDYVIFNNMKTDEVTLTFPDGFFEERNVTIPGGGRVTLKVVAGESDERAMNIDCTGGSGSPKVKIGEGP